MAVDGGRTVCSQAALQAQQSGPRARGEKTSVDAPDHRALAVVRNAKLGDFRFVEPFTFQAFDWVTPDFGNMHGNMDDGVVARDSRRSDALSGLRFGMALRAGEVLLLTIKY